MTVDLEPPAGRTRLVALADDLQVYTLARECDVRTAITRGLKEYVEQQAIVLNGGRETRFKQVLQTWSEPEQMAKYPSACVYAVESGNYDADALTPQTQEFETNAGTRYLRLCSEFVLPVVVECWTTDPAERAAVVAMLEDAFNPVDWMYGFRLELPHYHNARCTFELTTMTYLDSGDDAQRRYRKAVFVLTASAPLIRMPRPDGVLPRLDVRIELDVQEAPGPEFDPALPVVPGPALDAGGSFAVQGQRPARGGVATETGASQVDAPEVT